MDRSVLVSFDGATLINGLTNDINDSSESLGADGHENGGASVVHGLATDETFSGVESDGSDVVTAEMLSDLEDESVLDTLNFKGVKNWGKLTFELHVDDGTNDLGNLSTGNLCREAAYS